MSTRYDAGNIMVIRRCRTLAALDRFGLKLASKGHQWTDRERREYEKRVRELKRASEAKRVSPVVSLVVPREDRDRDTGI